MGKLVSFMHISLDGFTTGPKGEMDWIHVDDEIFDYAGNRTTEANIALYGRVTFEMMEAYWPTAADKPNPSKHDIEHSTWYNKVQKIVLSNSWKGKSLPNTEIINEHFAERINQLKNSTQKEIIMFGSPGAVHSLAAENLIDEYWLFVNPILVGEGISMFPNLKERIKLKLIESKPFKSGVVCMHYERQSGQ